jgi:hypothetical protein
MRDMFMKTAGQAGRDAALIANVKAENAALMRKLDAMARAIAEEKLVMTGRILSTVI